MSKSGSAYAGMMIIITITVAAAAAAAAVGVVSPTGSIDERDVRSRKSSFAAVLVAPTPRKPL
jgi:hypothetical protein